MKKAMLRLSTVMALALMSATALLAQGPIVSRFGEAQVQGRRVIVHVWVVVPPGLDENAVALAALREQGARPFQGDEFSTTGLVWDSLADSDPFNDLPVTQNYNAASDPTGGGQTALENTLSTWSNVATSNFDFAPLGTTTRCPSLVRECPGRQVFDGNNDVAWLVLNGCCTLGVTWWGTSIDEADMALNTNFPWSTDGVNDFDVETVFLHENGHVVGLGHSDVDGSVMEAGYVEVRRSLHQDDIDGITFLYPLPVGCTDAAECADSDACTLDGCSDGVCFNDPISCFVDACTTDICDTSTGCVNDPISCVDGLDCTADSCDPTSGCVFDDACVVGECTIDGCVVLGGECAPVGDGCELDQDCCSNKCRGGGPQGKSCKQ